MLFLPGRHPVRRLPVETRQRGTVYTASPSVPLDSLGTQLVSPQQAVLLSGTVISTGSDTLAGLMRSWATASNRLLSGSGSATSGDRFRRRYGYPARALPVAQDAIFSVTRQCGKAAPIRNWGTLGLPGEWRSLGLVRYGRNTASGTQVFPDAGCCAAGICSPR